MDTASTVAQTFDGRTAEEWREQERRCLQDASDSWERSDTDGYLSQWASQQMAQRYRHCADLAETGGRMEITAYADIETGEVIPGRWLDVQYGSAWAPFDRDRGLIFPSNAKTAAVRERNNAKKGVREVRASVRMLLNHRTYLTYTDPDTDWIVVDEDAFHA